MKPNKRKNIYPVLSDVKQPNWRGTAPYSRTSLFKPKTTEPIVIKTRRSVFPRKMALTAVVFMSATLLSLGWYLLDFKDQALGLAFSAYQNLKSAAASMVELDHDKASRSLGIAEEKITKLNQKASIFEALPWLSEIPKTILEVRDFTTKVKEINDDLAVLQLKGWQLFFKGEGQEFLALLKGLKTDILAAESILSGIKNKISGFGGNPVPLGGEYFTMQLQVDRLVEGLDALINFLERQGETHLAVVFENYSEIRPAGGFIGSYADLILAGGALKSIVLDDIYHPDRFLDLKVVPPKQLQSITPNWGARDANWFFNFPDSAEKILEFLEASSVYREKGVTFEGVIAVNARVMEDILQITGPVEVPEYNLVLNDKNFLREVQREVEIGRDKKPGQNPKKVLQFIMPKIVEKLDNLSNQKKKILADNLAYRLFNKDIKFYFKDKKIQSIITEAGAGGEIYHPPANWQGDYLAVVNANIAGGKTDAFMTQKIELVSKIEADGSVVNNLTITRTHNGENEKESWYRQINQNFIKIFTLNGSQLESLTGNTKKTVKPLVKDYVKSGYLVDEKLASLEKTEEFKQEFNASIYQEAGKSVFATWFSTLPGKTSKLLLTYRSGQKVDLRPGVVFQFVMDKQSGVESQFDYLLEAPPGFKWREVNDFIYRYRRETIPSRLIIDLTLEKI